jgi:hypothetical protein
MHSPTSIKVYIRNQAGYYLVKNGEKWLFTPDSREAHIFDYHADNVTTRLKNAQDDQGLILTVCAVEQNLAHEKCDVCGAVMSPVAAHFDGKRLLCEACMLIQNCQGG